ncbi:UDP-N-acetylmuramate dehydrogenase [Kocuria rhizophila]|uniref:UDP-N-acetylenolpyruvoylglucosamine reductase n=1 Tax=Kocuria rhizophila TaxID=72000 RepID=A0AAX2SGV0_KOCRH|nr:MULTISPECIES: UDP-N-acetylmuramate dehydrogenase [Kocuria]WIW69173.1 UDP-N-acetylmuramate dehydrogenase [Kocuria sp. ChxB]KUP27850.1 UDP-N-acetylenolpyruvoylglucosamine reductase [Kocuria rhizophila]MCR4526899.1 UDP-N-acetylmuramate dehydrogenase [Kocuria rhizophila]MCT1546239.1 UDP-N-acetylmuramate dehydrogenase [Kocuria rhizophila]MCT2172519.1 UDP-N-acetylmuramate dehydrogenase [Kocuria rhizophila]
MNAPRLSQLTSTAVGGPVSRCVEASTEEELVAAVSRADQAGERVLIVGGGSNILASDEPFEGTVVLVGTRGFTVTDPRRTAGSAPSDDVAREPAGASPHGGAHHGAAQHLPPAHGGAETETGTETGGDAADERSVLVEAAAGHPWDDLVRDTVERGLAGLETLAGIPGTTGATPVQNVGAYGSEVSQNIVRVRVWDRQEQRSRTFSFEDLEFSYRDSLLKRSTDHGSPRYVVLSVTFRLERREDSTPVRYAQLATALGVEVGERAPLTTVRDTVLRLRAGKGMVLDPEDRDTFSTGSFFTNPVVPEHELTDRIPADAPRYPVLDARGRTVEGAVKFSAAWLIDHAGFGKGFGLPGTRNELLDLAGEDVAGGRASLSSKHTLAMTNRGEATGEDVAAVARAVQRGVEQVFGVRLEPEPVLLGLSL